MIAPALHRKWAREYLVRAEHAHTYTRKRRYLQLAINNTLCARKLEAELGQGESQEAKPGPAADSPVPKR